MSRVDRLVRTQFLAGVLEDVDVDVDVDVTAE